MALFKMKSLMYYFNFRWDGVNFGGGDLRSKVARLCQVKFAGDAVEMSDNDAIKFSIQRACDKSTFFANAFFFTHYPFFVAITPLL